MRLLPVILFLQSLLAIAGNAANTNSAYAPMNASFAVKFRITENQCGTLAREDTHHFFADSEQGKTRWTDHSAKYWQLTTPIVYLGTDTELFASERFRVGGGAIRVESRIFPSKNRYQIEIFPEIAGDFEIARKKYLPNIVLPCHILGELQSVPETTAEVRLADIDPASHIRYYRLLHQASELIYDDQFTAANAVLSEAQRLLPETETALWLNARVNFLEAETLPTAEKSKRLAAYQQARALAEQAIRINSKSAEAHLWLAIAEGRIATSQGDLRAALNSIFDSGGPALIANSFERAIALDAQYAHFGDSAHADALNGAAQFYRLMPQSTLVKSLFGVAGNLDRSVELVEQAFSLQPDRIEYAKELGVSLLCRGAKTGSARDIERAKQILQTGLAQTAYTNLEVIDQRHLRRLLQIEPARACAYSRDGWQDAHKKVEGDL